MIVTVFSGYRPVVHHHIYR